MVLQRRLDAMADSATFWRALSKIFGDLTGETFVYGPGMPSRIISERAFEFARRVVKLCGRLWEEGPAARRIADQLFDSGTSIGANAEEAEGAQTKPDFIAKLAVSRKESREAIYWLRLAVASGIVTSIDVAWELDEAQQLKAMITQAIRTAQSSPRRDPSDHQP